MRHQPAGAVSMILRPLRPTDNLTAVAGPYAITGGVAVAGVGVAVNPPTPGGVSDLHGFQSLCQRRARWGTSEINADWGQRGTVFPNNSRLYTFEDSTSLSASGTVTASLVGAGRTP